MNDRLIIVLRWIFFIPIGLLTFLLVGFVSVLLQRLYDLKAVESILNNQDMGGYYFTAIMYYMSVNGMSTGCAILASSLTVPKYKSIIALVLCVLGVSYGIILLLYLSYIQYSNGESLDYYFKCFYTSFSIIIGALFGYSYSIEEENI